MTIIPDTDTAIGAMGTTIRIFTASTIQGDVGIGTDAGVEIVGVEPLAMTEGVDSSMWTELSALSAWGDHTDTRVTVSSGPRFTSYDRRHDSHSNIRCR